jgi:hypothetical protein
MGCGGLLLYLVWKYVSRFFRRIRVLRALNLRLGLLYPVQSAKDNELTMICYRKFSMGLIVL